MSEVKEKAKILYYDMPKLLWFEPGILMTLFFMTWFISTDKPIMSTIAREFGALNTRVLHGDVTFQTEARIEVEEIQ